ncbi:LacI family DNA-binding transcriptional regulator [Georgenia sp. TF02-10]|uniref:LacI family DNA-binding transcriptional regulator n=1 Tax=Georgenia sp. TF02-10 TaxID=2917725 RepID=UPI001FA7A80F|nr:LacI family DNA-binding transcriptional regulator [Georgenia sp. TF02-10]UNX53744.1 LacI family DNA-binding transcriptional regulator [Georgenia sp. TF02-10]
MLTMKDIAEELGVSVSTVSLVLNDRDRGRVRQDIADRVRARAEELGYVPNLLARGLKTRRSRTIGLVADKVATVPFAGQMLAGAQSAAWEEGYLLMVIDTGGNRELDGPATRALLQRDVEALVIAADYHREVSVPPHPRSVPAVVLDGRPADGDPADAVVPDDEGGARAATEHLIAAGHRRIGLVNIAGGTFVASELRRRGYQDAHTRAGLPLDPSLEWSVPDPSTPTSFGLARTVLQGPDRPTAVFCFSDQIALAFAQVAATLGIRVPEDLSLVGFDNQHFVADAMLPGLTTVQLPHFAMGEWAARRAIARLHGAADESGVLERIPCAVVERASVSPPPSP